MNRESSKKSNGLKIELGLQPGLETELERELETELEGAFAAIELTSDKKLDPSNDEGLTVLESSGTEGRNLSRFLLKGEEEVHSLYYGENLIGRYAKNHIVIDDPYVSGEHACIFVEEESITLFDFSTNGTCVNGEQVWSHEIKAGDKIYFWLNGFVLEETQVDKSIMLGLAAEAAYIHQAKVSRRVSFNAGFSLIELLIVVLIVGIISAIAIANISSSRRAANSASAIQSLRVISSSQASYQAGTGNGEFASSDSLVKEEYIDQSLAAATLPTPSNLTQHPKSSYVFVFNTITSNSSTNTLASYEVSARPLSNGLIRGGDKSFFIDATGVIRFSPSALAPFADANSQPLQ